MQTGRRVFQSMQYGFAAVPSGKTRPCYSKGPLFLVKAYTITCLGLREIQSAYSISH